MSAIFDQGYYYAYSNLRIAETVDGFDFVPEKPLQSENANLSSKDFILPAIRLRTGFIHRSRTRKMHASCGYNSGISDAFLAQGILADSFILIG